jgi:chromosomal replication initiator protein
MIRSNSTGAAGVKTIQRVVARKYSVSVEELEGKRRITSIAHPRQVAMYLACEMTSLPNTDIGRTFGGRNSAAVTRARQRIANKLRTNNLFSGLMNGLYAEVRATSSRTG